MWASSSQLGERRLLRRRDLHCGQRTFRAPYPMNRPSNPLTRVLSECQRQHGDRRNPYAAGDFMASNSGRRQPVGRLPHRRPRSASKPGGHVSDTLVRGFRQKIRPWSRLIGCSLWRISPSISACRSPPSTHGDITAKARQDSASADMSVTDGPISRSGSASGSRRLGTIGLPHIVAGRTEVRKPYLRVGSSCLSVSVK